MNTLRLLWAVIKRVHFDKLLWGFLACFFIAALIVLLAEPGVTHYRDALWYMFVGCTSIGFGDIVATTFLGRLTTVIMTIYEILIVAVFSGVVVSLYLEVVHRRENLTATMFLDKMSRLTELNRDELKEIQEKIRKLKP